jgi:2-polyprenyl-3-methyl-5-hydroxy-6-metoxy-1,4-benzoquinol methylase
MMTTLPPLTSKKLASLKQEFDSTPAPGWAARSYRSLLGHYYRLLIPSAASVLEIGCGRGELLQHIRCRRRVGIDISERQIIEARRQHLEIEFHVMAAEEFSLPEKFDYIVISDTLNYVADVQQVLDRVYDAANPDTRLIINSYNTLWQPVLKLARLFGVAHQTPQSSWLSAHDVRNLLHLANWLPIKTQSRLLFPVECGFLERAINRTFAPLLPWACLATFTIARPRPAVKKANPSVSVVVPARNEAGNIEAAVTRTAEMGAWTELIFIEGGSRDNTWEKILEVQKQYPERRISVLKQTGKGKGNAVREAFAVAKGDILMILDADLTMPPEDLPKFYRAIAESQCDFANGCRLVYPMEDKAMQFLNMIANKLFGISFSWLLSQHVKDTLCGTKVLRREHYNQIAANRSYFGEFDPFGDFDLLFGADKLNLQIADIPIRYRDRTYGSTNIQRWRHGWLLLKMVWFAARKIKFV